MQKRVVGGIILTLVTLGWSTMGVGEQMPAPPGEVRIVDHHPLHWACMAYHVFDHLFWGNKAGMIALLPAQAQAQPPSPTHQADPGNAEQVALGQQVYASFCAGCHGAHLEGQPNWQKRLPMGNFPAPPHDETGHTWHHADQWLFEIVKYGGRHHAPPRYRSAMPAYQDMLSDTEIWAVLAFIKSHWPASIRVQQEQQHAPTR